VIRRLSDGCQEGRREIEKWVYILDHGSLCSTFPLVLAERQDHGRTGALNGLNVLRKRRESLSENAAGEA
jgi:hypothetical protein